MKENGTHSRPGDYYIGLEVGPDAVGWAVTDEQYQIKKFKGNAMWGVRLFESAENALERRTARIKRRRLARKRQRLMLLELLFAEEIAKVDPNFYLRMHESERWVDEKQNGSPYTLFYDAAFTDREYHKRYPTVYHLRSELLQSEQPHDVRLVYLALHHIMKTRGHFLYETSGDTDEIMTTSHALEELQRYLQLNYDFSFEPKSRDEFLDVLQSNIGISAKKQRLKAAYGKPEECQGLNVSVLLDLLADAAVKPEALFEDESLKDSELGSIKLGNMDDNIDAYVDALGDQLELLERTQALADTAKLSRLRGDHTYISQAKVAQYEQNRADLRSLKRYVRQTIPEKYKLIFSEKRDKLDNYSAYSQYKIRSGDYHCDQQAFCKFLLGKEVGLPQPEQSDAEMSAIYAKIKEGTFLPRLRSRENWFISYQLNQQELVQILKLASGYLPFLNQTDEDGLSVKEKIIRTFEFRIPYYVGPISDRSGNHWAVRFAGKEREKVYPWNFETVIDTDSSAALFIKNSTGRCEYTGEPVLPKDSLLYSEFLLLNELNTIRVKDQPLSRDMKAQIVRDLFHSPDRRKQVTKRDLCNYLQAQGMDITYNDFKGIGINFKTALRSYHDFKDILDRTGDADMVEAIIQSVLVFRTDKKMLRRWLKRNTHGLTEGDIKMICGLQYQEWGTLSQTFLTEIYSPDENGEAKTIMDGLRDTDCDLTQLLSEDFQFAEQAQAHLDALFGCGQALDQQLIERRIPAALRRSIRQTLRIVDEIADMEKSAPKKIFLEVDNGNGLATKTRRTVNRKDELIALYKGCHETDSELYEQLVSEDEDSLRSNKLYLYYDQFGKCMYSGESIDREVLMQGGTYDIDHIIPQSKLRDHTMYNLVLVKSQLNREKADNYPIKAEIRQKMRRFWSRLRTQNMISKEKYDRLIRGTDLLRSELTRFVARQLNQNRNCVNMLTSLLEEAYGVTEIVYSKADNVADFRHRFGFVRCPNVNDLYHAKDAYLNIVVGNVYHCKFAPQFFANIENETYSLNRVFDFDTPGAWKTEESIQIVKRTMAKNNVRTTRMPHETTGALYKLQVLPAGKGQLEKKQGLDIQRYGGYDKLTGAYFFLVEHTSVRKGRIRTIESVYLCQKTAYEQDPIAYCTDVLHLKDPVIIAPKILVDAVLELNGARFNIAWRTSDDIVFRHTCQLIVDRETQQYINDLVKYNDHCNARGEKLPVTAFDGISAEKNLAFYELLTQKCGENAYRSCFSAFSIMGSEMGSSKQVFAAMSVRKQVAMLLEVLNAFRCNTTNANFKELSGKTARGLVFVRKNMSNMSSAYLVHQSVTGLYEYKTDLLK